MGYHVLRVHTAHDDLEFKTLEPKISSTTLSQTSNAFVTSLPATWSLRSVGSRSNDKQPLGLPFEERRSSSASFNTWIRAFPSALGRYFHSRQPLSLP